MLIPLERLIDGCMHTLREDVLASLDSRFARGRVYAVLDVLNNLRDRIEEKAAPLATECESAEAALAGLAPALEGSEAAGASLRALAGAADAPLPERAAALRAALVAAIEALPEDPPEAARRTLAGHLAAQAVRDIALLKPSLLDEISKG